MTYKGRCRSQPRAYSTKLGIRLDIFRLVKLYPLHLARGEVPRSAAQTCQVSVATLSCALTHIR